MPRCFRSRIRPAIGLSVARQSGPWVLMSPWASQPPLPPPAWQIWMNRTPCSASRRASSNCRPKSSVSSLADAVEVAHVLRLAGEIDDLRRGELHPGGQLVGPGAGRDVGVDGVALAELVVQVLERLHLPLALARLLAPGRLQIRDRRLARLERSGGHARAEVAAGQLHRRGRPADVHERGQVLVGAAQGVGDPAPEGRMIELPAAVPGAGLDHRREMVRLRGTTSTGPRRSRRSRCRRAGTSRRPGCPTCRTA